MREIVGGSGMSGMECKDVHGRCIMGTMNTVRVTPEDVSRYITEERLRVGTGLPYMAPSVPKVVCVDGYSMSVQASAHHYCFPRQDVGPWETVEVGFPSRIEPLLFEYAEEPGAWTDTVYSYVPIELVAAVIELHGGFVPRNIL